MTRSMLSDGFRRATNWVLIAAAALFGTHRMSWNTSSGTV